MTNHEWDNARRFTRRGVARRILMKLEEPTEARELYFETHPIADEFRCAYGKKKLDYWATERNPATSTGIQVFGVRVSDDCPRRASWPT